MVLVALEGVGHLGCVIGALEVASVAEIMDDIGYEVAIVIGALLLSGGIDGLLDDVEIEDLLPTFPVAALILVLEEYAQSIDIVEYLATDLLVVAVIGSVLGLGGGRAPTALLARTIIIYYGGGVRVVVLYVSDMDVLKGVTGARIAFDLDFHGILVKLRKERSVLGLATRVIG